MFQKEKITKIKDDKFYKMSGIPKDEYVESYIYDNDVTKVVHVGIDDYGQSYYIKWTINDKNYEIGCGTYNSDYMPEIEYVFEEKFKV